MPREAARQKLLSSYKAPTFLKAEPRRGQRVRERRPRRHSRGGSAPRARRPRKAAPRSKPPRRLRAVSKAPAAKRGGFAHQAETSLLCSGGIWNAQRAGGKERVKKYSSRCRLGAPRQDKEHRLATQATPPLPNKVRKT